MARIPVENRQSPLINRLEDVIFMSRWTQAPLYVGLIVAQCVYVYVFLKELLHLLATATTIAEAEVMLIVLGLVDVVMISNLLIMVIIGGYEIFVSRLYIENHPDRPEWMDHVNAGMLKVKLGAALIGISSIHLLKSFINAGNLDDRVILWQIVIHTSFVLSALGLAYLNRMMERD
jgi:uncharacterized protein (TIGR00645 family)